MGEKICKDYKFVKFSKATAKHNPEMICREYNKLIKEKANEMQPHIDERNKISECNIIFALPIDNVAKTIYARQSLIHYGNRHEHYRDTISYFLDTEITIPDVNMSPSEARDYYHKMGKLEGNIITVQITYKLIDEMYKESQAIRIKINKLQVIIDKLTIQEDDIRKEKQKFKKQFHCSEMNKILYGEDYG